jgi:hypothetical protein
MPDKFERTAVWAVDSIPCISTTYRREGAAIQRDPV